MLINLQENREDLEELELSLKNKILNWIYQIRLTLIVISDRSDSF